MDNLIVQKYGGSSLATLKQFDFVAKKVKNCLKNSNKIVIVVSAMGNTTDELVELGESFLKDSKKIDNLRDFDQLLSTGENFTGSMESTYKVFGFEENETATLEGYMQDYFGRILRKLKELSDEKEKSL